MFYIKAILLSFLWGAYVFRAVPFLRLVYPALQEHFFVSVLLAQVPILLLVLIYELFHSLLAKPEKRPENEDVDDQ